MCIEKISFILPVYNVEPYVEVCIKSIVNQNYDNWELIVIDDASTDKSGQIVDSFARDDGRIHVIHMEKNSGVSVARNVGLEKATGQYILFVDSDDYLDTDYASYLLELIKHTDADMAASIKWFDSYFSSVDYEESVETISNEKALEWLYLNKLGVAVWNKIYKSEFLTKNNIRFHTDLWFAEGMTFNVDCLLSTSEIVVGNRRVYHQTFNPNSAVRKFNLESWRCGMRAMQYQKNKLDAADMRYCKNQIQKAWHYHFASYYVSILRGIYQQKERNEYKKEIAECKKGLRQNKVWIFSMNLPLKTKIKFCLQGIFPDIIVYYSLQKEKYQINKCKRHGIG